MPETNRAVTVYGDEQRMFESVPSGEKDPVRRCVARKGGTIVTCASTSGFMHEFDNRYLWMNLKRITAATSNYREAFEANRLVFRGMIHPTLSKAFPLEDAGEAAYQGEVAVLALAPERDLGVTDPEFRNVNLDMINRYRNACARRAPLIAGSGSVTQALFDSGRQLSAAAASLGFDCGQHRC